MLLVGDWHSMNVEQLAAQEEEWLKKQRNFVRDRETVYEQIGVYAAWRDIFEQYVALAREGDLEALKRAVYFVWAECSMARLLTGLKDLDEGMVREALALADKLAGEGWPDTELEWMLPYYYVVEPSYVDRFDNLDALKKASHEHPFLYRQRCLNVSFDHRGQMGDYWQAEQAHLRRWP
jgi:hypothetical protein